MITQLSDLKNYTGFIRYMKNTSWMMCEHFLRIVSGLFVGILVARYLGPSQFGLFSYVLAFTGIFGGIAKLGLDGVMVRELVNYPEKREGYLGTAFWLKVFGAFLVIALLLAFLPFTGSEATTKLFVIIIAAGLVFQSFEVIDFHFQSRVLAKIVSICKVLQLSLSSVLKLYLVFTEADLIWFVLATAFDAVSLAALYFCAYQMTKGLSFFAHFDLVIAKKLLKSSFPLIFAAIAISVYMRIDQIMIKEMVGDYEAGIYAVAVRLSEAFYFIPTIIAVSLFPAILNAQKDNEELANLRQQRLYSFMVWTAVFIAFTLTFSSDWLVNLLFGSTYQDAGPVLRIHVWALIFVFLGATGSKWLIANNLQKFTLYNTAFGAVLNIVLNLILIPKFGLVGAAYATLISYCFAAYLMNALWKNTRHNFLMMTKSIIPMKKTR
jgi:O-antigen/teichoic acid export membrane protein